MASALTPYSKHVIGNLLLRNVAFSPPTQLYLGLATDVQDSGATITEVTGGAYVRQAAHFADDVSGVFDSNADIIFPEATANWGTITYGVLYDSPTGGNAIIYAPLATSRTINTGMIFELDAGQVVATF
jgi:hypothetical protein